MFIGYIRGVLRSHLYRDLGRITRGYAKGHPFTFLLKADLRLPYGSRMLTSMDHERRTVLVTGATGNQGGAVARLLLEKGYTVRALTRNAGSPAAAQLTARGAQIVEGNLENPADLEKAAGGVDSIFAMSTPFESGMEAEVAQGKAIADAAKSANAHLVYTSVGWANLRTGIPHFDSKWEVEQYIHGLGIRYAVLGPAYFMENLITLMAAPFKLHGLVAVPLSGHVRMPQIALADIAAMAALVLEQPDRLQGRRDIAGDVLTGPQSAEILSRVTGHEIRYSPVPIEAVRAQSEDLALMFEYFEKNSPQIDVDALRRDFPEVGWHTYEQWARAQDWSSLLQSASA
jgi:uncharacterized protein YbjT (DUF2867 family)